MGIRDKDSRPHHHRITGRDTPRAAIRRSTAVRLATSTSADRCTPRSGFAVRESRNVQVHAATCDQVALVYTLPRKFREMPANASHTLNWACQEACSIDDLHMKSLARYMATGTYISPTYTPPPEHLWKMLSSVNGAILPFPAHNTS
jgi:hypothetical protein